MTFDTHAFPDTVSMPKEGITCFHCGERFKTIGSAEDHFGATPRALTGCQIKAGEERGLLMAFRKTEASRDDWMQRALAAEAEVDHLTCVNSAAVAEIQSYRPFRQCNSIRDVFFVYDSIEGRALAAEAKGE
jgi:hypothetical protein